MKKNLILFFLTVAAIQSWRCTSPAGDNSGKAGEKSSIKNPAVYLIDSIEHLFGNENWQVVDGGDTSYYLFSRQNNSHIKVYRYRMFQGDSVNNVISYITLAGDSVNWKQPVQELLLQKAVGKQLEWKQLSPADTAIFSFSRVGEGKIIFRHGFREIVMYKTITLSDFLVRSRYDFLHGTHYAFDTIKFDIHKFRKH